MSYRNDRAKILEERDRKIKEKFSDEINQGDFSYDDDIIEYDTFFTLLLELKHHIITKDLEVSNDLFKNLAAMINISCNNDEKAYFSRIPQTLAGYSEYYDTYMKKILDSFPDLEKDIQEAIEENAKRYCQALKQKYPEKEKSQPVIETEVNVTINGNPIIDKVNNGNYNEIIKKRIDYNSKKYKEGRRNYVLLFRYYLSALIDETEKSFSKSEKDFIFRERIKVDNQDLIDDSDIDEYLKTKSSKGRKPIPLSTVVFTFIDQINEDSPDIEYDVEIEKIAKQGYIPKTCKSNSMIKYRSMGALDTYFKRMIELSSKPFNRYEHIFAIDASGFNCITTSEYYADRHHQKKEHDWCDLHIICGVNSNIITAASVHHKYKVDELEEIIPLVKQTQKGFYIDYLVGDGGYASNEIAQKLKDEYNVKLFFPIKLNTIINPTDKSEQWTENIRLNLSEIWNDVYHPRSNVETIFFVVKKRSGETITKKNDISRINEVYCKVLIHNIHTLIVYRSICEIIPDWKSYKEKDVQALLNPE